MLLILLTIGLALSMDTFSLALSLGTLNMSKKNIIFFPLIVGIFHFVLPIISRFIGNYILFIDHNKLLGIIFLILFIKLLLELRKEEEINLNINRLSLIILALTVSFDSFTTGLGLSSISDNLFIPSIIFLIESTSFTFLGLIIGKCANDTLGKIANYFGLFLLLMLAIVHLLK